jgi:flagellar motor protein MotB
LNLEPQGKEENSQKVPAYIVTFSDMVTLLLTFFVMLLSLAEVQDPELFNIGRDSFWQSVKHCGLGTLYGKRMQPDLGETKTKYLISDPNNTTESRSIDEQREKLRQTFERLKQTMLTMPSQIVAASTNYTVTDIKFAPGQAILDESAKRFLANFCLELKQSYDGEPGTLYVLGLAGNEASEKQQWLLSAERASVVANFLQQKLLSEGPINGRNSILSNKNEWSILWWGAGPGGQWAGQDSPDPRQSQILIAILKNNN